jgi:hypothetical protein
MPEIWAEIDARRRGEVDPFEIVVGVPPVARLLRQLGRLGWTGARVVVDDEDQARCARGVLLSFPAPAGLAIEVEVAPAPPRLGTVALDGAAIYHRDTLATAMPDDVPVPLVALRERADVARARQVLVHGIRKSIALDGVVAYYVQRPLTRPLVRWLVDTRVSPNQVTVAAMLCGLAAAGLAAAGGAFPALIAGLLYWLGGALDCIDGDLARLRLTSSRLGEWLDSMADETATYALCAGLGIGLMRDGAGSGWAALGIAGAAAGVLAVAPLYRDLHRRGLPIDTAQFPWFFQSGGGDTAERRGLGALVYYLGFLVRRDVNVTVIALLLVLDQRPLALGIIAAAAGIGLTITLTHYAVTALRRRG